MFQHKIASVIALTLILCSIHSIAEEKSSPWIATPLISSDPKMGTTLGGLAAYMHKFDKQSPISMFGLSGKYSNTDSYMAVLFGRTYFNQDQQRLSVAIADGYIKNSYEFEGIDTPLRSNDDLNMRFLRFNQRVYLDFFVGIQYVDSNYIISGSDDFSQIVLETLGLTGFDSTALGLVLSTDTRDNQQSASSGHNILLHNFAYREKFGGDESFDAYMLEYSEYFSHGDGHVLAMRIKGRWTSDAPESGFSSMELRGYTRGQYLAEHMTFIEFDERYALSERWGLTAFAGIGCLYGDQIAGSKEASCSDAKNRYPSAGIGASFAIKPAEKMVIRSEIAIGKDNNHGFYLNFGQPF
ncbi:MAG: hypothetical protein HRU20_10890 [Pseudomonadales bacterium]|nr:hypothetical protein [Pseudomonadales bacterium]